MFLLEYYSFLKYIRNINNILLCEVDYILKQSNVDGWDNLNYEDIGRPFLYTGANAAYIYCIYP